MADNPPSPPPDDDAAILVTWLRERDVQCSCGYNLRNLVSAECPECGTKLRLTVGVTNSYFNAWIACVTVTCAAAGIGTVVLIFVAIAFLNGTWHGTSASNSSWAAFFISSIPVVAVVLSFRRRFQRLSRWMQWSLAFASGAYFLVTVIEFISILD
jgi:hypothetical protein